MFKLMFNVREIMGQKITQVKSLLNLKFGHCSLTSSQKILEMKIGH